MTQNPAPQSSNLAVVPPPVFSAMLRSALDRSDMQRRQHAVCNDGRTGIIVDYSLGLD